MMEESVKVGDMVEGELGVEFGGGACDTYVADSAC